MQIKTNKRFTFCDDANNFVKKNIMISCTRLAAEPRSFILGLRNRPRFSEKAKQSMAYGKARHEELQTGLQTLNELGYIEYRKALCTDHKRIKLKELEVISPNNALYGIIDDFMIEFTKEGELKIWVTEYKGAWTIGYLFQMLGYVLILTDLDSKLVYGRPYKRKSKRGREAKREIGYLFPSPLEVKKINIWARLYNYHSQKGQNFEHYVINSQISGDKQGLYLATINRLHKYQDLMMQKLVNLEDFEHDDNKYCCSNFPHICPKVSYSPKEKQFYFGKKQMLIKSKPKLI